MPSTIREQIIAAFTARAQPLASGNVQRVQRYHQNGSRNISIWDGEETKIDAEFKQQRMQFPIALDIQWELVRNENASVSTSALIGEVVKAMLAGDRTFNGVAERLEYFSATPTYPDDGSGMVALVVIFNIIYSTKLGDPFLAAD